MAFALLSVTHVHDDEDEEALDGPHSHPDLLSFFSLLLGQLAQVQLPGGQEHVSPHL